MDFPKNFDFKSIEKKWSDFWLSNRLYNSKPVNGKQKYSVVIPPPNVTGMLHTGHILNNTIQDVYCRMKRLEGFEVCWVPGTDHAGIATQVVVEKELAKDGKRKEDIGREEFIKLVWKWKEKNGGKIQEQLIKLGASVDWSRERFTLDEGLSLNVRKVFVDLYKKGLIYRGNRIVNWDPKLKTAVSDDEILYVEKSDLLYFVKYPVQDSDEYITVATTRPETIFGDTAVAVNPKDKRFNHLKNKSVKLPLVNKIVPIIEDEYVDMEFGTGALKITPGHDYNDFEVGQRHALETLNILDRDCRLNELAGEFAGLDIDTARARAVEKLESEGLLLKTEEYVHNVAISDRSKAVIEPLISEQWFVSMKPLAGPAVEAVKSGRIRFHPDRHVKVYYHWMDNIRDWCISRQLWWGHQIPIWYNKTSGEIYCEVEPPADIENWRQDEDVLDTWFSSWLWPLSVFGWKNSEDDKTNTDLNYYYPTDFLSTGAEIIFLWVARMVMAGLEYMHDVPFRDVYFHSIVRDAKGVKMSKTLGNYVDPIEIMDKYGADALRFTIIYLAPLGNDVLFDEEKTTIGRNFITKLWNAGRMLHMNLASMENRSSVVSSYQSAELPDRWMSSRLSGALIAAKSHLEEFRINEYTKTLYNFVWNDFCDWYLEILKVRIQNEPENAAAIMNHAVGLYESVLKMLHPVIPYVTEELWHLMSSGREGESISYSKLPAFNPKDIDPQCESEFGKITSLISEVRNLRANNDLPFNKKIWIEAKPFDNVMTGVLLEMKPYVERLCNVDFDVADIDLSELRSASTVSEGFECTVYFEGQAFDSKQVEKLKKEYDNLTSYIETLSRKLSNENFISKASPEIVEKEKAKKAEAEEKLSKLKAILN